MRDTKGEAGTRRLGSLRPEGGFTLIELMVVVLIIGILIGIGLPTFLAARSRAEDRAAQSDLRSGLAAAMTYFSDGDTFTGFDTAQGTSVEPSLDWVAPGPPGYREVAIQIATGADLLLAGLSRSNTYFCLAQQAGSPGTTRGTGAAFSDVDTVAECVGGW
jgi:type IV pilus assembly protein PilA